MMDAVVKAMTRKSADRSRRAPGDGKRDHEVTVRFTASEWARIDAAAAREKLKNTSYIGMAALAAADPEVAAGWASRAELDALTATTEQLRRTGYLLSQLVMTMRALGEVRPVVERVADLVWSRLDVLDGAVNSVSKSMRARRGRRG
jgi:hypothetical protein